MQSNITQHSGWLFCVSCVNLWLTLKQKKKFHHISLFCLLFFVGDTKMGSYCKFLGKIGSSVIDLINIPNCLWLNVYEMHEIRLFRCMYNGNIITILRELRERNYVFRVEKRVKRYIFVKERHCLSLNKGFGL